MSTKRAKILIVEDEASMREILTMLLDAEGYEVHVAEDGAAGLSMVDGDIFDIVITDIKMPGAGGFEILKRTLSLSPDTLVIMITAFGSVESGIEAMKLGAYDYINKPFKIDEIRLIIKKAVESRTLKREVTVLRETVRSTRETQDIIGRSPQIQSVLRLLPKIASSASIVLITGESGTGKEVVAKAIHKLSPRSEKNILDINCASLPEGLLESELFGHMKGSFTGAVQNKQGLFELADEGTLFLDEIGEMSMNLQSKLLRAIEYGTFRRVGGVQDIKVNVRIIAATNKDLKSAIGRGEFREDLFHRLNVFPMHMPPLRDRKEDIPALIEHFLRTLPKGGGRQFSGSALALLMKHDWPGNIRELKNVVERTIQLADTDIITDADIPEDIFPKASHAPSENSALCPPLGDGMELEAVLARIETTYLLDALKATGGNKTRAAEMLGLTFRSFRHKLHKFGIKD